jgi:hypothetical protein
MTVTKIQQKMTPDENNFSKDNHSGYQFMRDPRRAPSRPLARLDSFRFEAARRLPPLPLRHHPLHPRGLPVFGAGGSTGTRRGVRPSPLPSERSERRARARFVAARRAACCLSRLCASSIAVCVILL